ncbi:hypothetical protein OJAV_G00199450 [Oryzias javanicus]|uniref:Uncharacterized protein n=1 Tax=Oryzias javanicus TaxID=123683 RepID=A0A3S2M2U0_ORYJA|nr:hypothetical protein OJAV_G00199450 [Oryzias javanicus]
MSTNDAAEAELRVVGGETKTVQRGTAPPRSTAAARQPQQETFDGRFLCDLHRGDTAEQDQSTATHVETYKTLISEADGVQKEAVPHRDLLDVQIQNFVRPSFTSSLSIRLSRSKFQENSSVCSGQQNSSTKAQVRDIKDAIFEVNGVRSSSPANSAELTRICLLLQFK